jgi:spore coat protein CotH
VACLLIVVPAAPKAQTSDDLFNPAVLGRIDLQMHSADWAKLKEDFQTNTYYPADFVWNGQTVRNVGIRSRGRGSRSANKPGLKVDFDQYADKQEFLGLKSLVLDNLTQDPSGIHETVTMRFFERLGIYAPRETHVKLFVNNEYIGLYGLIESIDKKFLTRAFGVIGEDTQNDGWLYEFVWQDHWLFTDLGTDLREIKLRFDATTHESKSDEEKYRAIQELITLANQTPVDRFVEVIGPRFDLPGFIRFVAAQAYVGETDGFLGAFGVNNFYLYRLENQVKHVMIAWDDDNAFWGPTFPVTPGDTNVLMQKLMRIPEYNAMWYSELAHDNQLAEQDGWLDTEIIRQLQMIDEAMKADVYKPYSNNTYEGEAGEMLSFAHERIAYVKCALASGDRACGG